MLRLANASNRFAAFACMQLGEWRDWERSAVLALRASLAACGFAEGSIDAYLFFGGIPVVTRTHGRRPVAFMNVLVDKLLPFRPTRASRSRTSCAASPTSIWRARRPASRVSAGRPSASRPTSRVWESGGRGRRSVLPRIFALKTRHSA